jgi:hypothetical protein
MKFKPLMLTLTLFTFFGLVSAQQPQPPRPDSRSAQVEDLRKQIDPSNAPDPKRQRVAEINSAVDDLNRKAAEIQVKQSALAAEKSSLLAALARDEAKANYTGHSSYTVVGIKNEDTVILLVDGLQRDVDLAGLYSKESSKDQAIAFLKEVTASGSVFARCTNDTCTSAFLYRFPTGESINAEMVKRDLATGSAGFFGSDQPALIQPPSAGSTPTGDSSYTGSGRSSSGRSRSSSGGTVEVKTYVKKDGTVVQGHTRKAPR